MRFFSPIDPPDENSNLYLESRRVTIWDIKPENPTSRRRPLGHIINLELEIGAWCLENGDAKTFGGSESASSAVANWRPLWSHLVQPEQCLC